MKTLVLGIRGLQRLLVNLQKAICAVLLILIAIILVGQVVARFVLDSPQFWVEEVGRYGLIWLTFVGAATVAADGKHITVEVFEERLSRRVRLVFAMVGGIITAATCLVLVIGSYDFVEAVSSSRSAALRLSRGWLYGVVLVALLLTAVHTLGRIGRAWTEAKSEPYGADLTTRTADEGLL